MERKKKSKEQTAAAWKRAGAIFLLYAWLPLLCGAMAGALLWMNAVGGSAAKAALMDWGAKNVALASGGDPMEKEGAVALFAESGAFAVPEEAARAVAEAGVLAESARSAPAVIYEALPADAVPVVACDLSSRSYFINTTKYDIDIPAARAAAFPAGTADTGEEPLVLVLHTHATESYLFDDTNLADFAGDGVETYTLKSTPLRSDDPARTVVQVGEVFCETLREKGVPALHCTEMHDREDFNRAYVNSAETVKRLLREHPSIQYVIDLHRDSVTRGDSYVKTYTEATGSPTAQVMLVVGTNQQGRHPNWLQNLSVAVAYKDRMDRDLPGFSRAMYLRTARFNQEYLPGCMLLEVGSAMNTLTEAEGAARAAAGELAGLILEKRGEAAG
ncbi:MAG: stage II sporulation protein P [Clostridia bacterium]|nr:stage II sporulation protein P [Clostridia bacterium]